MSSCDEEVSRCGGIGLVKTKLRLTCFRKYCQVISTMQQSTLHGFFRMMTLFVLVLQIVTLAISQKTIHQNTMQI